ncbi:Non-specific serine/threonine protein kinase protein [Dioscorea alata]|uniref:Non-specific serine/threonine protein kinase protein n=1 Tax=Dioscorea alata TaxID=55571 RepID=A0ACB7WAN3_DIOAL|nr:Non-specific serine/threonine protein kinase protein [Dioscorea alata]
MAVLLRRLVHLLLLLLLLAADVPIFCHAAPAADATAMASIAHSLTGVPSNWVPGNDPCKPKWDFVSCAAGRVVSLNLGNLSLSGVLSESINGLVALTSLQLQHNNISGPLPSLSSLSNLQRLLLDFNSFSSVPDDFLSGFTAIELINIDSNPFVPWSISNAAHVCVNLQRFSAMRANIIGSIPEVFGSFSSLHYLRLAYNDISGVIPVSLVGLKQLSYVDLTSNNLTGMVPNFSPNVTLVVPGNPFLVQDGNGSGSGGSPAPSPSLVVSPPPSPFLVVSPPPPFNPVIHKPPPPAPRTSPLRPPPDVHRLHSLPAGIITGIVFGIVFVILVGGLCCLWCWRKGRKKFDMINLDCLNDTQDCMEKNIRILEKKLSNGFYNIKNFGKECDSLALMKVHGQPMSLKTLRKATNNFCPTNFLGRGGFGVVFRGELNGTIVAVKRSNSIFGEVDERSFNAEIGMLKTVRHRNLVALLGYCMKKEERLLVYEFMSNGTLADHLFYPCKRAYPLDWKQRVTIALDVARGMDYLHSLANESFIHRDLKPSNILLNDDFRAKVSDFGLVKLVHTMRPMTTKLAGTFGYLAPEYACECSSLFTTSSISIHLLIYFMVSQMHS